MRKLVLLLTLILLTSFLATNSFGQKRNKKATAETPTTTVESTSTTTPIVAQVISGDLIKLTNGDLVRLMGADAPVISVDNKPGQEPWASQAREFVERLTIAKELTIKNMGLESDEYGRRIGLVYVGDLWLDYELVKEGLAVVQPNRYLDNKSKQELVEAQSEALKAGRGIWNTDNRLPQPPRDFRAANGLTEGDNSKNELWKVTASKNASSKPTTSNTPSISSILSYGDSNSNSKPSGLNANLAAASEALDSLKQIQDKVNGGIRSTELAKLIAKADEKVQAVPGSAGEIFKRLREGMDAYKLVLDALKKREFAKDDDRPKFDKFINGALDIANQSIEKSESILAKGKK
jgi:endonuclease YncB( thermonuclease family)